MTIMMMIIQNHTKSPQTACWPCPPNTTTDSPGGCHPCLHHHRFPCHHHHHHHHCQNHDHQYFQYLVACSGVGLEQCKRQDCPFYTKVTEEDANFKGYGNTALFHFHFLPSPSLSLSLSTGGSGDNGDTKLPAPLSCVSLL